ncbi:MAG: IGHMBP2 family helicase [Candidatus Bipolaricaulota bacterium]
MYYLLIKGLHLQAGPGDVMGTLINETDLNAESIGDIRIEGWSGENMARVEIEKDVNGLPPNNLPRVGNSEVQVSTWLPDEYRELSDYIDRFRDLVQLERREEMEKHEKEIRNLTGYERQDKGRALLEMKGNEEGRDLGGKTMIKFTRSATEKELAENEISVGDLVMISKNQPLRDDNPTGTVAQQTGYSLTVAFEGSPSDIVYDRDLRIDLYVNDITYQRMLEALENLPFHSEKNFVRKLLNPHEVRSSRRVSTSFFNSDLDPSQQEAVELGLGCDAFHCIHGPPGTGKTTTLIELIRTLAGRNQKILATAPSNVAVDNLVESLAEADRLKVVRVGHPARITPALRENSLDYLVQEEDDYQESRRLRDRAFELKDLQDSYQFPSGRYRRGLSDGQILQLARKGTGARGLSPRKIQSMAEWLRLQEEIDELFQKSDQLEGRAIESVLKSVDVVCTTNSSAGSELLEGWPFDAVVIDEATQATEPSCLIPLHKANRAMFAGDHRQLPPTILNRKAEEGLQFTLFERLVEEGDEMLTTMLRTQYRMNEEIMNFPSTRFYEGRLRAADEVRTHKLSDLGFQVPEDEPDWVQKALCPDVPAVFLDTDQLPFSERQRPGSFSRENRGEAQLIDRLLNSLLGGLGPEQIGVISPYDDQVSLLNACREEEDLEIHTVDGFQGREKETILLSFVRDNPRGEIGFLSDLRRLNVSLTRARRKLIMLGNSATLSSHSTYRKLITAMQEREGGYRQPKGEDVRISEVSPATD